MESSFLKKMSKKTPSRDPALQNQI